MDERTQRVSDLKNLIWLGHLEENSKNGNILATPLFESLFPVELGDGRLLESEVMLEESTLLDTYKDKFENSQLIFSGKMLFEKLSLLADKTEIRFPATRYDVKLLNNIKNLQQIIDSLKSYNKKIIEDIKDVNLKKNPQLENKVRDTLRKVDESDVSIANLQAKLNRMTNEYNKSNIIELNTLSDVIRFMYEYVIALGKTMLQIALTISSFSSIGLVLTPLLQGLASEPTVLGSMVNIVLVSANLITDLFTKAMVYMVGVEPTTMTALMVIGTITLSVIAVAKLTRKVTLFLDARVKVKENIAREAETELLKDGTLYRGAIEKLKKELQNVPAFYNV